MLRLIKRIFVNRRPGPGKVFGKNQQQTLSVKIPVVGILYQAQYEVSFIEHHKH